MRRLGSGEWVRTHIGENPAKQGNYLVRQVSYLPKNEFPELTKGQTVMSIILVLAGAAAILVATLSEGRDLDFAGRQRRVAYRTH